MEMQFVKRWAIKGVAEARDEYMRVHQVIQEIVDVQG